MRTLLIIALSYAVGTCSSPPSLLEQVKLSGEFRVVTRNSPVTFYYGPEEARGIDYELARGFAERLGVELRIYLADQFWEIFPDVAQGKAHVGAAGLTITEPRRSLVDFGPPYQIVTQQLIYRRGTTRPKSIDDLLGGRLEIIASSAHVRLLERARREQPLLSWIENPEAGAEDLLRSVSTGDIDYTIMDSNFFSLLRPFHPDTRAAFSLGGESEIAWALPKGEDTSLRESISAYFAELEASGELQELLDRYYRAGRDFDYVGSRTFVRHFHSRLPQYRSLFTEAAEELDLDWRLLAAMAYQESHWNPEAVSPTQVRGIMMLTRHTAEMMEVEDRTDARESIMGGARYFVRVLNKVPERIPEPDRTWLAVAAYNVGFGHLEDARVITELQGGDPDQWKDVRERLPLLSQQQWYERVPRGFARGEEPVLYVDNVQRYHDFLRWMTATEPDGAEAPAVLSELTAPLEEAL